MSTARRVLAIVLALAGAASFAIAVQGGQWWRIGDDVGIGTIATSRCFGGTCGLGSLAWTGGSDAWQRGGFATHVAGLVTAAVLIALAGALAAKRTGRLTSAVVIISTVTAIVAGTVFYTLRPELPGATIGRGLLLFGAGVVFAAAAAAVTLSARRPAA